MLLNNLNIREASLFTYVIASADMRYCAINERTVYLRNDPIVGPVLRGEICEHGSECHADLSQILLEYAMSCEGCHDPDSAGRMTECMGERLGRVLARKIFQDAPDLPTEYQVDAAFAFILHSMGFQVQVEEQVNGIRYDLACCPLVETAKETGISRGVIPARRGFIAICTSMLHTLAPEWAMVTPSHSGGNEPLTEIVLKHRDL